MADIYYHYVQNITSVPDYLLLTAATNIIILLQIFPVVPSYATLAKPQLCLNVFSLFFFFEEIWFLFHTYLYCLVIA